MILIEKKALSRAKIDHFIPDFEKIAKKLDRGKTKNVEIKTFEEEGIKPEKEIERIFGIETGGKFG
jgi:hypothetical protein